MTRFMHTAMMLAVLAITASSARAELPQLNDSACKDAVPEDKLRTATLVQRASFRVIEGTLEKEGLGHIKAQSLGDVLVAFTTDRFGPAGHCGYYNRGLFYEISGASYTDEGGVARIGHYRDGVQFVHPASRLPANHKLWAHKGQSLGKVVFLPAPIGKCDRDLGECKEAWQAEQARADILKDENACFRSGKEWKNGQCVERAVAGVIPATDVRNDLVKVAAVQNCESDGKFFRWSDGACLTKAQMAALVGASQTSSRGFWGWIVAAVLLVVLICFIGVIVWRRIEPAMEQFKAEVRDEPEVNRLRTESTRLQEIVDSLIERVKDFATATLTYEALVPTVKTLLRELAKLRQDGAEFEIAKTQQRDAAQAEVAAKQVALDAADARNAELAEQLRERDRLAADLKGARCGMQEAAADADRLRGELEEAVAEFAAFREEVARKTARDDAQDARIARLEQAFERDLDPIGELIASSRSAKRPAAEEAFQRLRAAASDLASSVN